MTNDSQSHFDRSPEYEVRSGLGYDIHRFAEKARPLWLGGVRIAEQGGLDGHSDADVLCHAIADALLGAAGLPDIGYWFPPNDDSCAGISSVLIVGKAVELIRERGGVVVNVDATLVAEAPKIRPHVDAMKETLASAMGIIPSRVGIKATTNECLGAIGRREGMAAMAVASVRFPAE